MSESRDLNYVPTNYRKDMDQKGIDLLGVRGEAAIQKYYGRNVMDETLFLQGGKDDGADLEVLGVRMDAKTTARPRRNLIVKHNYNVDYYVLCWPVHPYTSDIEIVGAVSRVRFNDASQVCQELPAPAPMLDWRNLRSLADLTARLKRINRRKNNEPTRWITFT